MFQRRRRAIGLRHVIEERTRISDARRRRRVRRRDPAVSSDIFLKRLAVALPEGNMDAAVTKPILECPECHRMMRLVMIEAIPENQDKVTYCCDNCGKEIQRVSEHHIAV